jgi:hypothetical protein
MAAGSPGPSRWWSLLVVGGGVIPIAGAFLADDSTFHAPRWIVAVAGGIFVLAGLLTLPAGRTAQALLLAGSLSGFAVVIDWLLLFTHREDWATSGDFPLGWLPGSVEAVVFYTVLGGVALVASGLALLFWLAALTGVAARLPRPLGAALLGTAGVLAVGGLAWLGATLFGGAFGSREPVVRLPFDGTLDDAGPHGARPTSRGDEVGLRPGAVGQALFVGGTRDWVDYGLPAAVDLSGSASLELWLRRDDWVNPRRGADAEAVVAVGPLVFGFELEYDPDSRRRLARPAASVGDVPLRTRALHVPPRRWTHVALVYDRPWYAARLYVDGERVARASVYLPPRTAPGRTLHIGAWDGANRAFRGEVDELRLYAVALCEGEIRASAASRP